MLKISINTTLNNIEDKSEAVSKSAYGWETTQLDLNDNTFNFNDFRKNNHILTGILSNNHRCDASVSSYNSIMLDFDKNLMNSEVDFVNIAKSCPFRLFVFGSQNNNVYKNEAGIPMNRIRVFIPTSSETLFNKGEYEHVVKTTASRLFKQFELDPKSLSASQYFNLSKNDFYFDNQKTEFLNVEKLLSDFPMPKKNKKSNSSTNSNNRASINSDYFSENDIITLKDKSTSRISNLSTTEKHEVFCLCCDPAKRSKGQNSAANAALSNFRGQWYIYCSSKNKVHRQDPSELDYNKHYPELFFSEEQGAVCLAKTELKNNFEIPVKIFQKQADWNNYCNNKHIYSGIATYLPRGREIFDPSLPWGYNEENETFNVHTDPLLVKQAKMLQADNKNITYDTLNHYAPLSKIVLENVFGEDMARAYFDWLSYILNSGKKTFTAWIVSTAPGSGKNLLSERLLGKIFGSYAITVDGSNIDERFNNLESYARLVYFNELPSMSLGLSENGSKKQTLKNKIGSNLSVIEGKGIAKRLVQSVGNYTTFSNEMIAHPIDSDDRRYIVIERLATSKRLHRDLPEFKELVDIGAAVEAEALNVCIAMLNNTDPVYKDIYKTPIENDAKKLLQEASMDGLQELVYNLKNNNFEFFADLLDLPEQLNSYNSTPFTEELTHSEFITLCQSIKGIPAKYLSDILTNHLGKNGNTQAVRKRLKAYGVVTTVRKKGSKSYKLLMIGK